MSRAIALGGRLTPGVNLDKVDIAAGVKMAAVLGYGDPEAQMVATYALQRWQRGEEDGAEKTWCSYYPSDYTSWRVIIAAAMAEGVDKCYRHDYNHREYVCTCDPPVEGDTGRD